MSDQLVLIDREALLDELRQAFDARIAEALLRVLDKVAVQVHQAGVTREDFRELKQIVTDLAEAQRRTEERVGDLESAVERLAEAQQRTTEEIKELAEAQRRTEERLGRLELVVEQLAEAQRRTEERLGRLELVVEQLAEAQRRTADTVGDLKGRVLEANYRDKAVAYFGRWLRRPEVVPLSNLWETLEARLSEEALDDVILLDLVVRGRPRRQPEGKEVWLAVEVSAVIDREDVARARRRAALLQQAGYRAIPVVAGERATQGAEAEAHLHKVAMLQDGRSLLWEEALPIWTKAEG